MLTTIGAFSGFSVRDIDEARRFWTETVGMEVRDGGMGNIALQLPGGGFVLMYPKGAAHEPASYTVLNLQVSDLTSAIRELGAAGLEPERYPGMPHDDDGGMRGHGPDIAWYTDPSGNIFSVIVPPENAVM